MKIQELKKRGLLASGAVIMSVGLLMSGTYAGPESQVPESAKIQNAEKAGKSVEEQNSGSADKGSTQAENVMETETAENEAVSENDKDPENPGEGGVQEVPEEGTQTDGEEASDEESITEEEKQRLEQEKQEEEKRKAEELEKAEAEKREAAEKEEAAKKKAEEDKKREEELALSKIQAGTEFYTDSLKQDYALSFSDDFAEIMDEIETDYVKENEIKTEDGKKIEAYNWQDILAVYLYRQSQQGRNVFDMTREDKDGLAEVFAEMNALVPDDETNSHNIIIYKNLNNEPVRYANLHVKDMINYQNAMPEAKQSEEDIAFLEKYSSNDCMLLCAASTGAKGFILQNLENTNDARKSVVEAAYSLVGKISYFWGGKSTAIGWDDRWGKITEVTAGGNSDTGAIQKYGLDCSGYISWVFLNGNENCEYNIRNVGSGTQGQWSSSEAITQEEAQAGDLVFFSPSSSADQEHVGIVVGKSTNDDLIVAHCNASDNGVVVESAYSAGFQYVRRPKCLAAADED